MTGFLINIKTLTLMIPELLQSQRYVCTYCFSQDHLELLFNAIRASGGWNNNPSVVHFQSVFRRLMVHCSISPGNTGNVRAQDDTVSLSAVDMSSVVPAAEADTASSPFECGVSVLLDHTYLPTGFGCLTENAYIAGFVVRQVMKQLSCDVCRNSLVCEAVPASFCESYHLLTLKNKGGLMIPSKGAVKVIRTAEHCIRGASNISSAAHQCTVSLVNRVVKADIGSENVFDLGDHIVETQDGINNHNYSLISLVVSSFHKLR